MGRRRWFLAFAAIVALLVCAGIISVSRDTPNPRQEKKARESEIVARSPTMAVAANSEPAPFSVAISATANHEALSTEPKALTPIPLELENAIASILLEQQRMETRNLRLADLASNQAAGVPRVQQECLMHLSFSLPEQEPDTFFALCSSQKIPPELRREFLDRVLTIRPTTLCVPLCERILQHGDFGLAEIAQDYLETVAAEGASR